MTQESNRVLVLTWKPEVNAEFTESDFHLLAQQCWRQGFVDTKWRFVGKQYRSHDQLVVFKQGKKPGLVGFGSVLPLPVGFDAANGERYVDVRLGAMRDHLESPFLDRKKLLQIGLRRSIVDVQSSGSAYLNAEEIISLTDFLQDELALDFRGLCLGRSPSSTTNS